MAESRNPRRNTYTIYDDNTVGTVQIADEVVAIIAGLAATEVDGVASMGGNITNELVGKLGMKSLSKGVKVEVLEGVVSVRLALNIKYGYSIPDTSQKMQEKVKAAIENMTGLEVADVNVSKMCIRDRCLYRPQTWETTREPRLKISSPGRQVLKFRIS